MMKRLLVIEDEDDIRDNILEILGLYDYYTLSAENGVEGVHLAREHRPDLILCDIRMPELDGFGVLIELRSDPTTAKIPFIFLTASAEREAMRYGMELGADDYITKPFTASDLIAAIETRLERHNMLFAEYERQIDRLQGAVSYMLPHELRTPLSVIMGYSDMIVAMGDQMDTDKLIDKVSHINRASKRLYRLVENILLYAQLEVKKASPELVKPLRNLRASQPHKPIAHLARSKALQYEREDDLHVDLDPVAVVHIFEDDLLKILSELLDNAFKFSKEGAQVTVTGEVQVGQYTIGIHDEGRGMTEEQVERIDSFMQFDRKLVEQQGAGLGLIIARDLTELYNGEMTIDSQPQQYTSVLITFDS